MSALTFSHLPSESRASEGMTGNMPIADDPVQLLVADSGHFSDAAEVDRLSVRTVKQQSLAV